MMADFDLTGLALALMIAALPSIAHELVEAFVSSEPSGRDEMHRFTFAPAPLAASLRFPTVHERTADAIN